MNLKIIVYYILIFFTALLIRLIIINNSLNENHHVDLQIYLGGGALIKNKINPYNYDEKKEMRTILRQQSSNVGLQRDQDFWNFWVSGNLPLNLLFFGLLSIIWHDPLFYRIVFGLFDSILSVLVLYFVLKNWQIRTNNKIYYYLRYVSGILLGVLSLVLLQWGTRNPEDKGIEILLILSTVLCLESKKSIIREYLSPILLGLSVGFKVFGIFLLPFYLYKNFIVNKISVNKIIKGLVLIIFFSLIWFIPFIPEVANLMTNRIFHQVLSKPEYASIWILPFSMFPHNWNTFRYISIFLIMGISIFGVIQKSITFLNFSGILIILFIIFFLIGGSLDRLNIGIVLSILFLGTQNIIIGFLFSLFYFILGIASLFFNYNEFSLSLIVLIYALIYIAGIAFLVIFPKNSSKRGR